MQTYISILRGINVGGNRIVRMEDLREWYMGLGFKDVQSYIQSGNLVFNSDKQETTELESLISAMILKNCQIEVPLVVLDIDQLKHVVATNPFLLQPVFTLQSLHVTFLSAKPSTEELDRIKAMNHLPDRFLPVDKYIYIHCPNGYGKTRLTNNFFESKLKVTATTRNWRTLNELIRLAEKIILPAENLIN